MSNSIGIDVGGTKTKGVLLDESDEITDELETKTPINDYRKTIDCVVQVVNRLERVHSADPIVGICSPGSSSPSTGLIRNANCTWINQQPFARDLAESLSRPVELANDADCFTMSEHYDDAAQGAKNMLGVVLVTGVGCGIILNGCMLSGPNRIAGEWGHNPLPWPKDDEVPGPLCYCGKRG